MPSRPSTSRNPPTSRKVPPRRGGAPEDPKAALAKEGRLWLLALICAAAGATTVALSGQLLPGVGVFLICLLVLGPALYGYERYRQRRTGAGARPPDRRGSR